MSVLSNKKIAILLAALILTGVQSCASDDSNRQSAEQEPTIVAVGRWNHYYVGRQTGDGFEFTEGLIGDPSDYMHFYGVVWTGKHFVAVGGYGAGNADIFYSENGSDWKRAAHPPCDYSLLGGVAYGNGILVAVGIMDPSGTTAGALVSRNHGLSWSLYAAMGDRPYGRITYDGSHFIATDGIKFWVSPDGMSWGMPGAHTPMGPDNTYASDLYVVPGTSQIIIGAQYSDAVKTFYSDDCMGCVTPNATPVMGGTDANFWPRAITGGGPRLIVLSRDCRMDYTTDPFTLNWSGIAHIISGLTYCGYHSDFRDGVYVAGRYLAVGGSTLTPDEIGFIGTSVTGLPDDWSFDVFPEAIIFSIAVGYPE